VRDYLDQVDLVASDGRFHYLALSAVLTVPDICSALESPDGEANGARYKAWVNQHVAPLHLRPDNRQPFLTGEDCAADFRNSPGAINEIPQLMDR
jgi:hypothetical protein